MIYIIKNKSVPKRGRYMEILRKMRVGDSVVLDTVGAAASFRVTAFQAGYRMTVRGKTLLLK